jgi:hypothetical protein
MNKDLPQIHFHFIGSAEAVSDADLVIPNLPVGGDVPTPLTIPAGFKTDFGTIPRLFWIFEPKVEGRTAVPFIVHDWLYTFKPYDRATCDLILYKLLRRYGMGIKKSFVIYAAVRLCGAKRYGHK